MKILLSPAKSIDTSKVEKIYNSSSPGFLKETNQLVSKLRKMNAQKLSKLMSISKDLAELNIMRYKNYEDPLVQSDEVVPSILAFSGEVYRGLDAHQLSEKELIYSNEKIRILSGLYGILKPMDLLYPYRLEMGMKWEVSPNCKNLYQFWSKKVTQQLKSELDKEEVIVNLASNEYFKVIDRKLLKNKIITPVFKEFKNGEYKIVMMYAKHARGAMARWLIQNEISDVEELKNYQVDGYLFDENLSNDSDWIFTR